jgi:FKBP-type peptidyl-prolyl cis-trans isomerase SlyD
MLEISKHAMVTLTYDLRIDDEQGEVIERQQTTSHYSFFMVQALCCPSSNHI